MGIFSSLFQHPVLLAAVAAVLIPIIIELLFRLHRRRIELPTIRWLLKHKDQKKIKRQNRLLILLRMLAIFFLVMAVARPKLDPKLLGGAVRKRFVVMVIDGTTSMGQQAGTTTAFDLAKQRARTLIRGLPEGTQVAVGQVADGLRLVAEPTTDLDAAANAVRTLRPRGGATPISEGIDWARELVEQAKAQDAELDVEVYVFSDFQTFTWGGDETGTLLQKVAEKNDLFLVDVAPDKPFNAVVSRFEPVEPIASVGVPVEFRATLEGYAALGDTVEEVADAPDLRITFLVNGQKKNTALLTGGRPEDPRPGDTSARWAWSTKFKHTFTKPGEYVMKVEAAGDQNTMDNTREYIINVPETHRVLIFDAGADLAGTAVDEDEATRRARKCYYLKQAIEPDQPAGHEYEKVTPFKAVVRNPGDVVRENFGTYAAVCLAGLSELPDQLVRNCEVYVRDGGALMIFLDDDVNRFDYQRKLVRSGRGLMPVILGAPVSATASAAADGGSPGAASTADGGPAAGSPATAADQHVELALGDSNHPWMASLSQGGNPVRARVTRYMPLTVEEAAKDQVKVVATFTNGAPAIVEQSMGRGHVCLFTFTADARWIDLPALTQFLPLVQETLRNLVGNPDRAINLDVGDRFTSTVLKTSQHIRLETPGKEETVRLTPTGGVDAYIGRIREAKPAGTSAGEADTGWTDIQAGTEEYGDVMAQEVKRTGALNSSSTFTEMGGLGVPQAYRVVGLNASLLAPFVGKRVDVQFKPVSRGWKISYTPKQQGLYRIDAQLGVVPRSKFVANLPVVEGDPSRLTQDEVRGGFSGVPFMWIQPTESTAELVAQRYAVLEAALMLLWLVAGLLAIESVLAAIFGRRRGAVAVTGGRSAAT